MLQSLIMSTLEIKKELHDFINQVDDKTVKSFYKIVKSYMDQVDADRMIAESEDDITYNRTVTIAEAKKMISNRNE